MAADATPPSLPLPLSILFLLEILLRFLLLPFAPFFHTRQRPLLNFNGKWWWWWWWCEPRDPRGRAFQRGRGCTNFTKIVLATAHGENFILVSSFYYFAQMESVILLNSSIFFPAGCKKKR